MHDSSGFDRAYTLYSGQSSEKHCPSLQQPRPGLRERSIKVTLPVVCSWWWPPLEEQFSHKKRSEKCHTYVKLEAFAGACVQPISGIANIRFLVKTTTLKSLSIKTCCFCLTWKVLQLCGKLCQLTWGPVSREVNTFRAYYGATNPALPSKWPHFISNRQILREVRFFLV